MWSLGTVGASVPAIGAQFLSRTNTTGVTLEDVTTATIELLWLPVGAGTGLSDRVVAVSSRCYERVAAGRSHRAPQTLVHAALRVCVEQHRLLIEMAPAWADPDFDRLVVATGPVGDRRLGRWRAFTYEIRCWRDGRLPDEEHALEDAVPLSSDPQVALRLVGALANVPRLTWGRDEVGCGEMWNSNSIVAWLLAVSGCCPDGHVDPPADARAPGWAAGRLAAGARVASRAIAHADGADTPGC